MEDPDDLITVESIVEMIKAKGSKVVCETHNSKEVEYYCKKHDEFLCLNCMLDHVDHKKETKNYCNKQLATQFLEIKEDLIKLKDRVIN